MRGERTNPHAQSGSEARSDVRFLGQALLERQDDLPLRERLSALGRIQRMLK